jgi:hypothetical protein
MICMTIATESRTVVGGKPFKASPSRQGKDGKDHPRPREVKLIISNPSQSIKQKEWEDRMFQKVFKGSVVFSTLIPQPQIVNGASSSQMHSGHRVGSECGTHEGKVLE